MKRAVVKWSMTFVFGNTTTQISYELYYLRERIRSLICRVFSILSKQPTQLVIAAADLFTRSQRVHWLPSMKCPSLVNYSPWLLRVARNRVEVSLIYVDRTPSLGRGPAPPEYGRWIGASSITWLGGNELSRVNNQVQNVFTHKHRYECIRHYELGHYPKLINLMSRLKHQCQKLLSQKLYRSLDLEWHLSTSYGLM